jgi:hypothetical protein
MSSRHPGRFGPEQGYCCCSCQPINVLNFNSRTSIIKCGNTGHLVFSEDCLAHSDDGNVNPPCNFCFNEWSEAIDSVALNNADEFYIPDGTQVDKERQEDEDDVPQSNLISEKKKRKEVCVDGSEYNGDSDPTLEYFLSRTQNCDIIDPMKEFFENLLVKPPVQKNPLNQDKQNILFNNLFSLLCCIAFSDDDFGLVTEGVMVKKDQRLMMALKFDNLKGVLPMQSRYKTAIFDHCPGNTWPTGFLEFVQIKQEKTPSPGWISEKISNPGLYSPVEHHLMFWGQTIRDVASGIKSTVTNEMNPKWTDTFASGFNHTGNYYYRYNFLFVVAIL